VARKKPARGFDSKRKLAFNESAALAKFDGEKNERPMRAARQRIRFFLCVR
jgi:hypothetical protein